MMSGVLDDDSSALVVTAIVVVAPALTEFVTARLPSGSTEVTRIDQSPPDGNVTAPEKCPAVPVGASGIGPTRSPPLVATSVTVPPSIGSPSSMKLIATS